MEERIGLVFSWDPRARLWVKERGPADAATPPADPIDNEAVQTYFLDSHTGRWESTILGSRARQIAVELASKYRAAMVVGIAILPQASARKVVPQPDNKRKGVPLMAGIAAIVVVIGAGAFVAQAMRPTDVDAAISTAAPVASAPASGSNDPAATAEASAEATPAPTAPGATPVRTAPPRSPAPTAPPVIQTVTYSSRLANGTTVTYSGPNSVIQGAALDGVLSIRAKVTAAKGAQPMNFSVGKNGSIQTLGTITVR